ncbi:sugar ABC transporter substrate-binding protein [Roseomonas aerophila]|uniref:Sugar ABC transporter substrate-binding protein n=1 Tax=Teichococcus aerophilus TaxID=1224513 RepID=A0ABR7RGM4_9PROT|nr:sugar ABC transporter substrate-binding protein [Pseudoroseomonas aerophila]MBC9205583.1 sugar ABC transporter substrate-binding protein [Pseudoroseomonas aerophila]
MLRRDLLGAAGAALTLAALPAAAQTPFELAVIGFQMSSETHARAANAAAAAAKERGWNATLLNSEGSLPKHAEQFAALIQRKPGAIVVCMGKPTEADAQFEAAAKAGIPVITIMSGSSPHALFDIAVNEYQVGAQAALWLLGRMNYRGGLLTTRFEGNTATRIRGKVLDAVLSENQAVTVVGSHAMARTASWQDDVRAGMQALLLRNRGRFQGVWASFDGQAYVIDDLLQAQDFKKGQVPIISVDGGKETYRRIADPDSTLMATVAVPFEEMGRRAAAAVEAIVQRKQPRDSITTGPYLLLDAELVDQGNVQRFLTP